MGFWENQYIHHNNPFLANIIFFGRYIDDIIIIWDGPLDLIQAFTTHCNNNKYGLSFTYNSNQTSLAFLDLELRYDNHEIYAKNYTKPTCGNSYLHFKSCHYPPWIKNIPKGQFCRLRQNCTRKADYIESSVHLKNKFFEKVYPEDLVETAYKLYLHEKPPWSNISCTNCPIRFITTFHSQHNRMEKILRKHWDILQQDPHLRSILPTHPQVTYRRAPNLKNKIAPSKLKITSAFPPITPLIPLVGMFQCWKKLRKTCHFVQHGQKSFSTKGQTYILKDFYNCSSDYVVYGLTCPCASFMLAAPFGLSDNGLGNTRGTLRVARTPTVYPNISP